MLKLQIVLKETFCDSYSTSIERSWSWNESDDVYVLESGSGSADVLVSVFLVNGIAFSCGVGCGATLGVAGAFFEVEKISEVEVEYVEAVLLMQ